jgi:hypothetical protein
MVTLNILGGTVAIGCFKPESPGAAVPCKEIPACTQGFSYAPHHAISQVDQAF